MGDETMTSDNEGEERRSLAQYQSMKNKSKRIKVIDISDITDYAVNDTDVCIMFSDDVWYDDM